MVHFDLLMCNGEYYASAAIRGCGCSLFKVEALFSTKEVFDGDRAEGRCGSRVDRLSGAE